MSPRPLLAALLLTVALPACDSTEDAEKTARDASQKALDASKDKAGELAADAEKLGKDAADASKKAATDVTNKAVDASKKAASDAVDASKKAVNDVTDATRQGAENLFEDLTNDGELSQTAKAWIAEQAKKAGSADIESIIQTGAQLTPVALEASKLLADAVDSDRAIEPIFQKIDDDPAKVDKAIGDMPRVEAIDGVTVGFKQMDSLDADQSVKERGYLVMWRHDEHLVGFVYRSKRTIDLKALVAETPRLIALTQQALT